MQNTRNGGTKDVRLPFSYENNASKTSAQFYGGEATNYKQHASPYHKIGFQVQHSHNTGQTQNLTNVYTDGLNIQKRPIGETVNKNFQGLKMVRQTPQQGSYRWTFNPQDSSLKAPFASYNLPRSQEPSQYVGV